MMVKYWVIPCKIKAYDVNGAFNKLHVLDWKQSRNMKSAQAGDIVFIYLTNPIKAIQFMCVIQEVNKPKVTIDDDEFVINSDGYNDYGNYMELRLLKNLNSNKLSLDVLQSHFLKGNIQGPRSLNGDLLSLILSVFDNRLVEEIEDDELENTLYKEGKVVIQYGTKYERNLLLRKKAIEIHGTRCKVCDFDFEYTYGELGQGFIEIHHKNPMYIVKKEIEVNPATDLVPLCSNCHKMIHRKKYLPMNVDQLRDIVKRKKEG